MNELIKINYESDRPTVSGRELHETLEVKTAYKDWFPRMCEYGFVEGEDYGSFLSHRSDGLPGKPRTDIGKRLQRVFPGCRTPVELAGRHHGTGTAVCQPTAHGTPTAEQRADTHLLDTKRQTLPLRTHEVRRDPAFDGGIA